LIESDTNQTEAGDRPSEQARPEEPAPLDRPPAHQANPAVLAHLCGVVPVVGTLATIVLWLEASRSKQLDEGQAVTARHATEALNFQLTLAACYVLLVALDWISFGYLSVVTRPIAAILWLASLGLSFLAARAAKAGRDHLYPIALRPIEP